MVYPSRDAKPYAGLSAHLLLRGEVVPELPHQVLLLRAQLLGRRVAHNDLVNQAQMSSCK